MHCRAILRPFFRQSTTWSGNIDEKGWQQLVTVVTFFPSFAGFPSVALLAADQKRCETWRRRKMLTMAHTQKYLKYSAALVRLLQELRRCESALRPEIIRGSPMRHSYLKVATIAVIFIIIIMVT